MPMDRRRRARAPRAGQRVGDRRRVAVPHVLEELASASGGEAVRREQRGEPRAVPAQRLARGCLPDAVAQCAGHHVPRRTTQRPGAEFVGEGIEDRRRRRDETGARAGEAEELANGAEHDQAVTGFGHEAFVRTNVDESLVDDDPGRGFE